MFDETVDSLTFYSLLYCLYPGLLTGGERGGGSRGRQLGGEPVPGITNVGAI